MSNSTAAPKLAPLKIYCTSADCTNGLHAFSPSRDMRGTLMEGACRVCKKQLIEWDRMHARNINDIEHIFASLQIELVRHYFWHLPMPQRAIDYATRKGWSGLRQRIPIQLCSLVGASNPTFDGRQTPRENSRNVNPIHFAQHATASCCRKCIEVWHGIPKGRALTQPEISYLSQLAIRYLEVRLPNLSEAGQNVPRRT